MQTKEELLRLLSGVLPTFLNEAKKVLGDLPSTKVKKEEIYTEKDIQKIYDDIVLSKVKNYNSPSSISLGYSDNVFNQVTSDYNSSILGIGSEFCPRCGGFSLSKKYQIGFPILSSDRRDPDLYTCSSCKLELTSLEYNAVQRLRKEGKIPKGGVFY